MPRLLCLFITALGFVISTPLITANTSSLPITRAIDVRNLSLNDASRGLPVRLKGVVVHCDAPDAIFIQDDTGGAFFLPSTEFRFSRGDIIEISGRTQPGLYFTGIFLNEEASKPVRKLGTAPLPEPKPARYQDLVSGKFHYERVEIEGIVRTRAVIAEDTRLPTSGRSFSTFRVSLEGGIIEVKVHDTDISRSPRPDSSVRIVGLAAGRINTRRQLVQAYVAIKDWENITILEEGPSEEELPVVSESEILTFGVNVDGDHRIRLMGTVLAATSDQVVYLRGENSAFAVQFAQKTEVEQGDRIEILGFPRMDTHTARIVDAALVKRDSGPLPQSIPATMEEVNAGAHDSEYIEILGEVTDNYESFSGPGLTLQVEGVALQVRGQLPEPPPPSGALVRVRGVCVVQATTGIHYNARAETVSLMLGQPDDLEIVEFPSGWTVRRLAMILAVLLTVVAIGVLWIWILRRQVRAKAEDLQKSIAAEAALQERQRIARDFHDTLEQELAGLHLRLDAAATRAMDPKGSKLLRGSQNLVSRIQVETRNLISDLRSPHEMKGDLVPTLEPLVSDGKSTGVAVSLRVSTELPRFAPRIVHHLRMIVFEAVTNGIKHAQADEIRIQLSHTPDIGLEIEVTDDGVGFDVSAVTQGRSGHFGCIGIQERCRSIGATAEWESAVGQGTLLRVRFKENLNQNIKPKTEWLQPTPHARL